MVEGEMWLSVPQWIRPGPVEVSGLNRCQPPGPLLSSPIAPGDEWAAEEEEEEKEEEGEAVPVEVRSKEKERDGMEGA